MFSNSLKKNELYIKIGEKLVIGRKTSRRKINSISKKLNLSHDYINWIESGEIQNFPKYVPVHAFINSYAKLLKVDISIELEELRKFSNENVEGEKKTKIFPNPLPSNLVIFIVGFVLICFILVKFL